MTDSVTSAVALPPGTATKWLSTNPTFTVGSSGLDGMSKGRSPESNERSATREARLAERTEAKVALASTNVPPPVVSAEIITQSAMATQYVGFLL